MELLPALTHLRLTIKLERPSLAATVHSCTQLRTLELLGAQCAVWGPILCHANLRASLQHLVLYPGTEQTNVVPSVDWEACFANLHALQTLTLLRAGSDVAELLGAVQLHGGPSLRELVLDALLPPGYRALGPAVAMLTRPSLCGALAALLETRKSMCLRLRVQPHLELHELLHSRWPDRTHIDLAP